MGSKNIFYDAPGKFQDNRFEKIILPLGDGLTVCVKN